MALNSRGNMDAGRQLPEPLAKAFALADADMEANMQRAGQCTLGKLITLLSSRPLDQEVVFDFCRVQPGHLISWRGVYAMLALTPNFDAFKYDNPRYQNPITVRELLAELKAAIGKTFTGYKGGEFTMGEDTFLWVDAMGESTNTAIMGIEDYKHSTIISTRRIEL